MAKRIFGIVMLLIAIVFGVQAQTEMRVMSFNIRYLNNRDSLPNQWVNRVDRLCGYIDEVNPDLLGLQEAQPRQVADMKKHLSGYECLWAGRENGAYKGEATPVFYRKERFKLLGDGHFWLSETPDSSSFGWDADCKRIAQWVLLQDVTTGQKILYCNTHFDHIGLTARKESAKLLKQKLREIAPEVTMIISADFNTNEAEETYSLLTDYLYPVSDTWKVAKEHSGGPATWQNWGKEANTPDNKIDFIFVSQGVDVPKAVIAPSCNSVGEYYSDHNAIWCDLLIK